MKKKKGMALVMALYVTAIVFSLAAFFIADQFHKSKIVADSQDEKLALEAADMGLAYMVNYLGDVKNHWRNSIEINTADGDYLGHTLEIARTGHNQPPPGGNPKLLADTYAFSLEDPIPVSPAEKKSALIRGTLTLLYQKNDPSPGKDSQALSSVGMDIIAAVQDASRNTVASREIQWSGRRLMNLAASYQCWNCADSPGYKPPNVSDGTDNANYLAGLPGIVTDAGGTYTANAPIAALSQNPGDSTDYSTNPLQSPYGTDQDGNINLGPPTNTWAGSVDINSAILAENHVAINQYAGGSAAVHGPVEGKGVAVPLPSGAPWGTFDPLSSGPPANAPQAMSRAFAAAASDGACADGIKTVFVASSADAAAFTPYDQNYTGQAHAVEFPYYSGFWFDTVDSGAGGVYLGKPGFAVTDISLNPADGGHPHGLVTVTQLGYYSGGILYQEQFDPAQLTNHTLYVQGGNVRVHGDLESAGLTVAANQAESWNGAAGKDFVVSAPDGTPVALSDTACVAPNFNIPLSENSLLYAQRTDSSVGGADPGNPGVNYWVPNSDFPTVNSNGVNVPPSTGVAWPRSSNPGCTQCLYDGKYRDGSGNVVGEHVDDVNGRPLVAICAGGPACTDGSFTSPDYQNGEPNKWTLTCADSDCDRLLNKTIYAPPPKYAADGTPAPDSSGAADGNTLAAPAFVNECSSTGSCFTGVLAPYPGSPYLPLYQCLSASTCGNSQGPIDEGFSTLQFENSEGNLTIAGDTIGNALGLAAQNYVFVNDMTALSKILIKWGGAGGLQPSRTTYVAADVASFSKSMQWEGTIEYPDVLRQIGAQSNSGAPDAGVVYMNGDYTALNGGTNDGGGNWELGQWNFTGYFNPSQNAFTPGALASRSGHPYGGPGVPAYIGESFQGAPIALSSIPDYEWSHSHGDCCNTFQAYFAGGGIRLMPPPKFTHIFPLTPFLYDLKSNRLEALVSPGYPGPGWTFAFSGFIYAPYADVLSGTSGSGNYNTVGYASEIINLNRASSGPPPTFPLYTFPQWQALGFTAIYPTVYYRDMGAPHA